jgi:hypothetical protein
MCRRRRRRPLARNRCRDCRQGKVKVVNIVGGDVFYRRPPVHCPLAPFFGKTHSAYFSKRHAAAVFESIMKH